MLPPNVEAVPNLFSATLDEVLAIRVLVDHELDGSVTPDALSVMIHEPVDRCLDFSQVLVRDVLNWQMEEQVAMLNIATGAFTRPHSHECDASAIKPLVQALT